MPTKILLIKTSSLGDVLHTMPAVTDMARNLPSASIHWLVEESLADLPYWHRAVAHVHTCAIRRWRNQWRNIQTWRDIKHLKQMLRSEQYDLVIDAQGLIKSAWMARWLLCTKAGFNKQSIKEPLASFVYDQRFLISKSIHAIERVRQLCALALGYQITDHHPIFNLHAPTLSLELPFDIREAVFLMHGSQWDSKVLPMTQWAAIANTLSKQGFQPILPWGSADEKQRADHIALTSAARVLPSMSLSSLGGAIMQSRGAIGSDSGLTHMAAALGKPTVALFGATSSSLTAAHGTYVQNIQATAECAPCFKRQCTQVTPHIKACYQGLSVNAVVSALMQCMEQHHDQ